MRPKIHKRKYEVCKTNNITPNGNLCPKSYILNWFNPKIPNDFFYSTPILFPIYNFQANKIAPTIPRNFIPQKKPRISSRLLPFGWMTGFEPATLGTTNRCSNQLSYNHHLLSGGKYTT